MMMDFDNENNEESKNTFSKNKIIMKSKRVVDSKHSTKKA